MTCIGYAYALEAMATQYDDGHISTVEAHIPEGINATRCLRLHSGVGADADHVDDAIQIASTQPAEDRIRIAQAVYDTARIIYTSPVDGHVTEEWLEEALSEFKAEN